MKIIKYFNRELVKYEKAKEKQKVKEYDKVKHEMVEIEKEVEVDKPIYEIKALEYTINDKEYEKWYNIIKETYGKYGEVTIVDGGKDKLSKEEMQEVTISKLKSALAELSVQVSMQ